MAEALKTLKKEDVLLLAPGWYWARRLIAYPATTAWSVIRHQDDHMWSIVGRDYSLYTDELAIVELRGPLVEPPSRLTNGYGEICP